MVDSIKKRIMNRDKINVNLVIFLYVFIIAFSLLYMVMLFTPFSSIMFICSILAILILILMPISILYNGFLLIKKYSFKQLLLLLLSVLSLSWLVLGFYIATILISNF